MSNLLTTALLVLSLLAGSCVLAQTDTGPIQLATTYEGDINVSNYLVSEKLDGIRARWTGTELVTRNGNPIISPVWFTEGWPDDPLDGELWTTRGDFERIASIVLSETPDTRWQHVSMMVFDMPLANIPFEQRLTLMAGLIHRTPNPSLTLIPQFEVASTEALDIKLEKVIAAGGEGLMLHHKKALYQDGRSTQLLKAKRYQDAEAMVIGYSPGKGKYKGMLGALIVKTSTGTQFKIGSGLSDEQRRHPPALGSWVTYRYLGFTNKGKPRFASFLHVRPQQDLPENF